MSSIIDELKKQRIPKDASQEKLIEKMYEDCIRMIKFKNINGITNMIYEIPHIYMGFPLYDIQIISVKFNKFLKTKGFKTTLSAKKIYIKW